MKQRYKETLKDIGNRIFLERRNMGLTQKDFAEKVGVSEKYVTKLESGSNMTANLLISIIRTLHIDPTYLFTGNSVIPSAPSIIRKMSMLTGEQYKVVMQTIDQFIEANSKQPI